MKYFLTVYWARGFYIHAVKVIVTLFVVFFVSGYTPVSQAKTFKIATLAPAGSTWMKEMKNGARQIKTRTNGRVNFKFYPGGVMGNDQTVYRKIRARQLQGGVFTSSGLSQVNTAIQALSLPMMFRNYEEVDEVRKHIDNLIKEHMRKSGLTILGITEGGFARIMSSQSINSLEELKRLKVWLPQGDTLVKETYDSLGIQPIPLPIADVFTGLQTGLIDTIASTSTGAIAFQWHSKINSVIDLPVLYVIGVLAISNESFTRISETDKTIVMEEMGKVSARLDKINREDNLEAILALENQGIRVSKPNEKEILTLKAASASIVDRMVENGLIAGDLVDEIRIRLKNYRIRNVESQMISQTSRTDSS